MPKKNIALTLALASLLLSVYGCGDFGKSSKSSESTKNHGAPGIWGEVGGDGTDQSQGRSGDGSQSGDSNAEQSGPTQAFEVTFDGLTVESIVGEKPGSSSVQFKEGDKILLKEIIDGLDGAPKLIYAEGAEGAEHLPIRLANDDTKVVIIGFSKDGAEFSRIYKVSLPQESKDKTGWIVSRLAQIEDTCSLEQTSNGQHVMHVEVPFRFSGARRVTYGVTLCLESDEVVLDRKAMKAEVPDASKIESFIAEARAAFSEKEEIKALIKAEAKKQKLGNSDEISDAEAYDNDPLSIVPPELADGILHCIVAGRLDLGHKILDAAWPSGLRGKQKYWQAVCAEVLKSPYGEQIRLLNKGRGKFPS